MKIDEILDELNPDIKDVKPKEKKQTTIIKDVPRETSENTITDIDKLYDEIIKAIADPQTTKNKLQLDGLVTKAKALKEFEMATTQRLKNKQMEENLYTKDEIINIITVATAIFRNSLIDLPNNLAGTLDGLNKKQIKDKTTEIVNEILEDFNKTAEKFN